MNKSLPPTIAPALRPDSNSRQMIPGARRARPSRFSATRSLGASLVAIVAMVLCASRASGQVTDALWAVAPDRTSISVCQNPTDPASISSCFGAASQINLNVGYYTHLPVTDGTNVYIGNYSCPVADYGQNCTQIQLGWTGMPAGQVAAANGYLFLADPNAEAPYSPTSIYRCPSNLPLTNATSMPSECEEFAALAPNSGRLGIYAMVYANGKLYIGLSSSNGATAAYLVSCNVNQAQDCTQLDKIAIKTDKLDGECEAGINALAVGSGYVWLGMVHVCDFHKNLVLRADPVVQNSYRTWDTPAEPINSLAHDGQSTLWATASNNSDTNGGDFTHSDDVVWSCPTTSANSCTNVITNVHAWFVTAGAGNGFSSVKNGNSYPPIAYQGTPYPQSAIWANNTVKDFVEILYVPAAPGGVGGMKVRLSPPEAKVARVCAWRGTLPATLHVKGPHRLGMTRRFDLCEGRSWVRKPTRHFDLLSPGTYTVRLRSSEFSGTAAVEVTANRTTRLAVKLRAPGS